MVTANLVPSDLENAAVVAHNPTPGGGTFNWPFGANPDPVDCSAGPCVSNMRGTRATTADGRGRVQPYATAPLPHLARWQGGSAAQLRDDQGRLLARVTRDGSGGRLPWLFAAVAVVSVEDETEIGTGVVLDSGGPRADGDFVDDASVSSMSVDNNPRQMDVGDINGDGNLDFAIAQVATSTVDVWWGNGDTTFSAGPSLLVSSQPTLPRIADLDFDGLLDVLVFDSVNHIITTYFNIGGGQLELGGMHAVPGTGIAIDLADLDGDQTTDILVSGSAAMILLNNGDRTFAPPHPPRDPRGRRRRRRRARHRRGRQRKCLRLPRQRRRNLRERHGLPGHPGVHVRPALRRRQRRRRRRLHHRRRCEQPDLGRPRRR
jgi:hypothetical protein